MKTDFLPRLRCPDCRGELTLRSGKSDGDVVVGGTLHCDGCGSGFAITDDGIPRLLPSSFLADADDDTRRKRQEMRARDDQVTDYDKLPGLQLLGKIELPMLLRHARVTRDTTLLEGGCGNGRMTHRLARHATHVVAVDFSLASLRMNAARLQAAGVKNVTLLQADLSALPLAADVVDRVISCQVIEHLPSHTSRAKVICEFSRVSRPDARVVITGYKYNLFERVFGSKEGEHAGQIPYFRFTRSEFEQLMREALEVERVSGSLVYCWLARCVNAKA